MAYNFHSDLSNDFSQLLETKIDYNVVILVGKDFNASKIPKQEKSPVPPNKVPGQEKPQVPPKKVPGQEKPMRTKVPGCEEPILIEEVLHSQVKKFHAFHTFYAHSNILRIRSEYFNKIFANHEVVKDINGIYYIQKPNI